MAEVESKQQWEAKQGLNNDKHGANNDKHGANNDKHGANNDKHGPNNDKHGPNNDKHGLNNDKHGANNDKHGHNNDKHGANNDKHGANNDDVLERTVFVENLRTSVEKLAKILRPLYAEKGFGEDCVVALVRRRDGYEVTFKTPEATRECLDSGFTIERRQYDAVSVSGSDVLVNLNSVPAYVEDSAIAKKLADLGCTSVGEVRRVKVEGVETGRRRVLVQMTGNQRSLPRTMVVKSVGGGRDERIEVFHRNQRIRKNTR